MRESGLIPATVLCSPALRTRETLAHVLTSIGTNADTLFVDALYEADSDQLMKIIREQGGRSSPLLIVGHNPAVQNFTLGFAPNAGVGTNPSENYPTASLAVIDADIERWAELEWSAGQLNRFVRPRDLS